MIEHDEGGAFVRCPGCHGRVHGGMLVAWVRWSDGVLVGPFCRGCRRGMVDKLYDEDGNLVAYLEVAWTDAERPDCQAVFSERLSH